MINDRPPYRVITCTKAGPYLGKRAQELPHCLAGSPTRTRELASR
jgi:hypothetical protein